MIKNYAIIDSLEINWPDGLIAITGETGAGKSIMIGALQFVLGARADNKVLRNPDEKCIVEVTFTELEQVKSKIKDLLDGENPDQLIIRREILPNGKSRSFLNDSPVLVSQLNLLAPHLINIHQQFDHLDILEEEIQMDILDNFTGSKDLLTNYQSKYKSYKSLLAQKKQLLESQQKSQSEMDFLQFQLNELEQASLKPNEYAVLEEELNLATKSGEILKNAGSVAQILNDEKGISEQLLQCLQLLKPVRINPILNESYERLDQLRTEIKDIGDELERLNEHTEMSPEKINQMQDRLDLINRLLKKHRLQTDHELIELMEQTGSKIQSFTDLEDQIIECEKQIKSGSNELKKLSESLTDKRKSKTSELEKAAVRLLQLLGMEFAQFKIELKESPDFTENGKDQIDFLFSANKGSTVKPIKNQASGGELSRLNLVLKSLVAKKSQLPTMIFDEIDTGVSGQVALQMGNILKEMSSNQQLITITHSAQVASRAAHHFYVFKDSSKSITNTRMKKIEKEDRTIEIAKMLSGDPPTDSALKNASELIALN
ncbi:MAG: DNA repair protein RecN [Saprospiraceae bacterium]|nr:DNA repair protein RecN [Candidatus Vicinibacter affinis]MBK6572285.1 DNA repair protein RecN [Candidatus Vicinibacter affinis]MBK9642013.1 DNA repair protein RecN [Candidatus Vicinibacter affinis]